MTTALAAVEQRVARGTLPPRAWLLVALGAAGLGVLALGIVATPMPWRALLALGALSLLGALVLGRVRGPLLAAILLDIPLELDAHLAHQPDIEQLGAIPGFNVSLTTLALGACLVLWLASALAGLQPPGPAWRASAPAALYIGIAALSLLWAESRLLAAFEVFLLLQLGLLYLYLASTVRTVPEVLFVVRLLLLGVVLEVALAVALPAAGMEEVLGLLTRAAATVPAEETGRFSGTLSSPTIAGAYFSLLLPLAMGVLLIPSGRATKGLALLALASGGLGLLLTETRGAWTAFAIAAIVFMLALWRRGRLSGAVVLAVGVTAALGLVGSGIIVHRLEGYDEGSSYSRLPLVQLALVIIQQHGLLGVGANNYALAAQAAATPNFGDTGDWLYLVHNKLLLVWAETGLAGLAAFLLFLASALRNGWRCWRSDHPVLAVLGLGMVTALIGDFVHMQVDIFNARVLLQLLWVMAGLLAAMERLARSEGQAHQERKR